LYNCGLGDIPVYAGRQTPGVVGEQTELDNGMSDQMKWADGFDKIKPQKKPAAGFIIETLNKYPGEVILFTVGPVDNIADVIDKDPEALKKAKQVISMFGSIKKGYGGGAPSAEWNVRGSIEAGKKLMNSGANILLAPLDCTDHVIMTDEYLTAIFNRHTPLTDALGALYALWWKHADWAVQPKMFDGVAVGMALWPELFTTEEMFVSVDDKGFTKVDKNKNPNCTVGLEIDKDEFLKRMYRKLVEQNFTR
jgi:inosine-uridine nucleoside N-ribohydrolase